MNPYINLPKNSFWKQGVVEAPFFEMDSIYTKKFVIDPHAKFATAGSCFAQHISKNLALNGYSVIDQEPAPLWLPREVHSNFGYSLFSARYGNIYTVASLLQLAKELNGLEPENIVWQKDGRYYDALRPSVEPSGFNSAQECRTHRRFHLLKVKELFRKMDIFIFTLGLTEAWIHNDSKTVFPTAPGVIAGTMDEQFSFINFGFQEIIEQFNSFIGILGSLRNGSLPKIILSVSPVPLTATASGKHILNANSRSKSILRAVAGQLEQDNQFIDYFPSFEIITNPSSRGNFFENNLRSVNSLGIKTVMQAFFNQHQLINPVNEFQKITDEIKIMERANLTSQDPTCDDAILEAFGK
jgi:hypothetical protein